MYLGRATNLRSRTASYWGDLGSRAHLRRMVPQIGAVEALACTSVHEAAWLERNLLERGLLRWNRARGGAEVVAWVALDADPRIPALSVVHQPSGAAVTFGPFLGADRTRLVRSGLARVWQVGLVGTRRGSTERDLARARRVELSLDQMVAAITGALTGEVDHVDQWRAGLLEARQRASDLLAFEVAARITDELAALEWAVAPQRVTRPGPDARVVGWCEGVAVELDIVGGSMNRWRQRLLARPPRAALDRTPPQWRGFATANAELAARLLGRA